jgi:hypothetical protein
VRGRHVRRPPDLTSLFDVLFIVVFAALIRAAAVENAAARAAAPPRPRAPVTPPAVAALRQQALTDLAAALAARAPLVARITRDGTLEALEVDGKRIALVAPLLEHSADPALVIAYAGDRSADLQVCRIAARHLGTSDLSRYLVIMAPAATLDELPDMLYDGLHRDLDRCLHEQHAEAVLIDPAELRSGAPAPTPAPRAPAPRAPAPRAPASTPAPGATP